ncbi:MAG: hypothetical protein IKD15_01185 [Clostridia bacterium]|nr:hypothetical protein [Clostridia bacterium]
MDWMKELQPILDIMIAVGVVLLVAAILAVVLKSLSIYVAFSLALGGVLWLALSLEKVSRSAAHIAASVLLIFGGVTYLLLFCIILSCRVRLERKQRRRELARRVQYTLPQKENTYVRTRLNTALSMPQEENLAYAAVRLGYVRELLAKVKATPLSVGERLQVEEMGKILSLYKGKEDWTIHELNRLNDMCASLLKLSAKYGVSA